MRFRYAALTDIGLRRQTNEDAYIIKKQHNGFLFGIADGMGGHACGEIASTMACRELHDFLADTEEDTSRCASRLKQRFFQIDDALRAYPEKNGHCQGMGTTLSVIVFLNNTGIISHVGDSRIHQMRPGTFRRLTTDHNLAWEMVQEGLIDSAEASRHPFRNKLTQVIGTSEPLETVETTTIAITAGDRFVLSTDGIHSRVAEKKIQEVVWASNQPQQAAEELLHLALAAGGEDNITVITIFLD